MSEDVAEDVVEVEEPEVVVPEGFISMDKHQKDFNVQYKKANENERGRIAAEEKALALQAKIDELSRQEVIVPPVPDKYSDSFDHDIAERDAAISAQAEQNAINQQAVATRQRAENEKRAEENLAIDARVATFDKSVVTNGLSADEVKAAAESLISSGISNTFQDILLDDQDGPLLVKYLDNNPLEAEQMNGMGVAALVNHINTEVRPKAMKLKPRTSNAPEPPIVLTGGGAPQTKESWEEGAIYE